MNNSKVLALKYRPKVFKDLIGQEIVAETIFNSISSDKIPNAFLFHGIRGTGKTSIARIIAKALNCEKGLDNLCQDKLCNNCESITSSNHLDVIEQDCATATGIDSVRDLIDFCRYPPTTAKYKVLILDEIQAMSKAGAQSLLKILEEPPSYVKFIFCTTEIRKILVTMLSRCTRFDLSRVNFDKMFNYLKDIKQKENGKISDEALKLISKCSEGSVRDALSLLDRALLSSSDNEELDLATAQKIFGHFDKSKVIDLINLIIEAEEEKTFEVYRSIFQNNVEPITFLNDFLEILYYIKNIDNIKLYGKNFDLNDQEFNKINEISKKIDKKTIILFWHFTIKILDEIKIVSNQNIAIEMFIFRLMYLKSFVNKNNDVDLNLIDEKVKIQNEKNENNNLKNFQTVNQIKNVAQKEEKNKNEITNKYDQILSFDELINLCSQKKEMSLKYELETNVNLVNFEKNRIDIAFNDKINKNFIKDLSNKLLEWTNERWILTLSKESGKISKKDKLKKKNDEFIDNFKNSKKYNDLRNIFDDIIIKKVEIEQENND
tara:strand:- start:104 stop:1747 length:1644 start_codon:yes stop_codon:yes gene_type:complete